MPGRLEFYTTGDGGSSAVERVRIDSSGYLIAKADIRLRRTSSDNGALYFGDTNNNYIFGSDADDVITFATAGTERLRISSGGYVNIGPAANPRKRLDITGPDGRSGASSGNSDTALLIDNDGVNGAIIEMLSDNNAYGRIFFTDTDASNQGLSLIHI